MTIWQKLYCKHICKLIASSIFMSACAIVVIRMHFYLPPSYIESNSDFEYIIHCNESGFITIVHYSSVSLDYEIQTIADQICAKKTHIRKSIDKRHDSIVVVISTKPNHDEVDCFFKSVKNMLEQDIGYKVMQYVKHRNNSFTHAAQHKFKRNNNDPDKQNNKVLIFGPACIY